jgi:hypothetical protein
VSNQKTAKALHVLRRFSICLPDNNAESVNSLLETASIHSQLGADVFLTNMGEYIMASHSDFHSPSTSEQG